MTFGVLRVLNDDMVIGGRGFGTHPHDNMEIISIPLALVVFSQVLCSILIIASIATRPAAILLIIAMLVAAFVIDASDGFGKQELPLMYTAIYAVLAMTGAGRLSVDNWLYSRYKPLCTKE